MHVGEALNTYPVANVPATIWHGGTAMAPSTSPATRSAPGAASVGAGTRAGVVPTWAPMGTGPVDRHTLNSEYVMYLCHTHNRFINVIFNLKKKTVFVCTRKQTLILPGFWSGSRTRSGPGMVVAIFGVCWWVTGGSHRAPMPRLLDRPDTEVRNTVHLRLCQ